MDVWAWMAALEKELRAVFGQRMLFLGLQGSQARGEATEDSDMNVVLILDRIEMDDLRAYDGVLARMPEREKAWLCGRMSRWRHRSHPRPVRPGLRYDAAGWQSRRASRPHRRGGRPPCRLDGRLQPLPWRGAQCDARPQQGGSGRPVQVGGVRAAGQGLCRDRGIRQPAGRAARGCRETRRRAWTTPRRCGRAQRAILMR